MATTISQQTWGRLERRALFVGLRCFDYCDGGLARSVSNIEAIIHHPSGKLFVLVRVCISKQYMYVCMYVFLCIIVY